MIEIRINEEIVYIYIITVMIISMMIFIIEIWKILRKDKRKKKIKEERNDIERIRNEYER